jgi:hypothetical protein
MRTLTGLVLALSLSSFTLACNKKAAPAEVDCEKLMDKMISLTIKYAKKAQPDKAGDVEKALTDKRKEAIDQCNAEKGKKPISPAQYDCMMKAEELEAFTGCMATK